MFFVVSFFIASDDYNPSEPQYDFSYIIQKKTECSLQARCQNTLRARVKRVGTSKHAFFIHICASNICLHTVLCMAYATRKKNASKKCLQIAFCRL